MICIYSYRTRRSSKTSVADKRKHMARTISAIDDAGDMIYTLFLQDP